MVAGAVLEWPGGLGLRRRCEPVAPSSVAVERAEREQPKSIAPSYAVRWAWRCDVQDASRRPLRFLAEDCPVMAQWGLADRSVLAWQSPMGVRRS